MWIESLPNGKYRYYERYRDKYKKVLRVAVTLDKNNAQTRNKAQRLLLDKIREKQQITDSTDVKFWSLVEQQKEIANLTSKESTQRSKLLFERKLKKYLPQDIILVQIDKEMIVNILQSVYYTENLSYSYLTGMKSFISGVFDFAINKGYITENNVKGISIDKKIETLSEREKKASKYFELDELRSFIKLADTKNHRMALFIEFMTLTGLRKGEVIALQIKDIDGYKLSVAGNYDSQAKGEKKTTPKNKYSIRTIGLPKRAIEILNEVITENITQNLNKAKKDDYIWVNSHGNPIFATQIDAFLREISNGKITSHVFRHTHISLLTELNVPLKAIMERVGHNNPQTTLEIYSHVTKKLKQNIVDKLDEIDL
jgi:integrase